MISSMLDLLASASQIDITPLPHVDATPARLQMLLTTMFSVFAAASLLVIVIAGQKYTHSDADPGAMSKAKNTIIFASVGLVLSMTAVTIVTFVLNNL